MKTSYIFIIIAVVVLGGVFFFASQADNETAETEEADQTSQVDQNDQDAQTQESEPEEESQESEVDFEVETEVETQEEGEAMSETDGGAQETSNESEELTFNLDGFNFGYSTEEIRVQEGDTVTINLTSTDGFHDWVVDEFGASTAQIQTGNTTSVTFVADEAGTYEYYCSVGTHRAQGMVGTLIVEER